MKKVNIITIFAFIIAYAIIFSIGMECLLLLLSASFSISLDSGSVTDQYPRFFPFCMIAGLLALVALAVLFVFNLKVSEKYLFTEKIWCVQMISAFIIALPMIKLWEMLFDLLQRVF